MVCKATSVVCGAALVDARLDPAGVLLARRGQSGCDMALNQRYVQASEPELVSQVCEPVMCVAPGEPTRGGGKAGQLGCGSELTLESEATSDRCELVSVAVMLVPGLFGVDPVRIDSAPVVVDPLHAGCV